MVIGDPLADARSSRRRESVHHRPSCARRLTHPPSSESTTDRHASLRRRSRSLRRCLGSRSLRASPADRFRCPPFGRMPVRDSSATRTGQPQTAGEGNHPQRIRGLGGERPSSHASRSRSERAKGESPPKHGPRRALPNVMSSATGCASGRAVLAMLAILAAGSGRSSAISNRAIVARPIRSPQLPTLGPGRRAR